MRHFIYVPFTGLGLYNGFRGNKWLENRIKIFKQFVVPSLLAQTNQYFIIWISWRPEEKNNKYVHELWNELYKIFGDGRVVFTFNGVCFWDDKYEHEVAHQRLIMSLHHSAQELLDHIGDVDDVIMTIQPSDDCYHAGAVEEIQQEYKRTSNSKRIHNPVTKSYYQVRVRNTSAGNKGTIVGKWKPPKKGELQAVGYSKGYIMSYQTKEVREYNPDTNPPFFSYWMSKKTFIDPLAHLKYTGPYKSHEYIGNHMRYKQIDKRGFIVGTHGENISTHFNIPYAGKQTTLQGFNWMEVVKPLKIRYSIRKRLMRKLPHKVQRKLRYWFGELLLNKITSWKKI